MVFYPGIWAKGIIAAYSFPGISMFIHTLLQNLRSRFHVVAWIFE